MHSQPSKPTFNDQIKIDFPNHFLIKVICHDQPDTADIIRQTVGAILRYDQLTIKASKGNNYQSISFKVHAQNRTQLDEVYRKLSALNFVIMTL